MSIDIKKAVCAAREQAMQLFADEVLPHLALEEITFDEQEQHWLVTFGFDAPNRIRRKTMEPNLFPTFEEETPRKYKTFRIDAQDGHLISMTIFNP